MMTSLNFRSIEPKLKYRVYNSSVHELYFVDTKIASIDLNPTIDDSFIAEWYESEKGKWLVENSPSIHWDYLFDPSTYATVVRFAAYLTPEAHSFFVIKFS